MLNFYKNYMRITLALLLCKFGNGIRNFDVQFTQIECILYDRTLLSDANCVLERHENKNSLNMSFRVARAAPDWHLRTQIFAQRSRAADAPLKLFDVDVRICDFLDTRLSQNIFLVFHKVMLKYINEMPHCPLKENSTYTFTNFHMDAHDFPAYTPEGVYNTTLRFYEAERTTIVTHIGTTVVYKRKLWQSLGVAKH